MIRADSPPAGVQPGTTAAALLRHAALSDGRVRLLALGTVGLVGHQVAEALVPVVIGAVIDRAIVPGDAGALVVWLVVMAVLFVALTCAWRVGYRSLTRVNLCGAHALRQRAIGRVLHPRGFLTDRAGGEVMVLVSSDTARTAGIGWVVGEQVAAAAALLTAATALLLVSVPLGVAVLVTAPVMLVAMHAVSVPLEARSEREQAAAARAGALAADFITGLRVLTGLGAGPAAAARYAEVSRESLRAALRANRADALYRAVSTAGAALFLAGIALAAGRQAAAGLISIGELVAVVGLAQFVQGPLTVLGFFGVDLAQKRASARRLAALLSDGQALPAVPAVPAAMVAAPVGTAPMGTAPAGPLPTDGRPAAVLRVHPGSARWPAFEVAAGEMIGIDLADAGAARHLVEVLGLRSPAEPGAIRIGGHDLAALAPAMGRGLLYAPPRETGLVGDTLAAAITSVGGTGTVDPRLVRLAALTELVGSLPDGLATTLPNDGGSLSGGQRQRVLLCRALHQSHPVLVLHEPTTAVDAATESEMAAGLRSLRGPALVIVTRSPILLAACDRVVRAVPPLAVAS